MLKTFDNVRNFLKKFRYNFVGTVVADDYDRDLSYTWVLSQNGFGWRSVKNSAPRYSLSRHCSTDHYAYSDVFAWSCGGPLPELTVSAQKGKLIVFPGGRKD